MIRITLAWFQYQAGMSYAVLSNPNPKLAYVKSNFNPAVRTYLRTITGTIDVDTPFTYPKLRTNNFTIMEAALVLHLTDIQMKILKQVRMHLEVM